MLPEYAHGSAEDAGMDLVAVENVRLEPGVPALVPTGLAIELPAGADFQSAVWEAIRDRVSRATSPLD